MAATIEIWTGARATLHEGVWSCDDPLLRGFIERLEEIRPTPRGEDGYRHYEPNPEHATARTYARIRGGKVVSWDKIDYSQELPNAIY